MLRLKSYTEVPNAGDAYGRALAKRIIGGDIVVSGEVALTEPNLLLVGSILHWADAQSIVCGAGFLQPSLRPLGTPRRITAVRGPLTAAALRGIGIACPEVYGDPGILVASLFPRLGEPDLAIGIVPHYVDIDTAWVQRCRAMGILVLDPRQPLPGFLGQLQRCQTILSSSLHGVIFAHAYGRPALWLQLSDRVHGDGFKFFDYFASVGIQASDAARCRVTSTADPVELARAARRVDTTRLIPRLQQALNEAATELAVA